MPDVGRAPVDGRSSPITAASAPAALTTPATWAASGPAVFARYAFGPNRLGLCGPDDWRGLLQAGTDGTDAPELRALAQGFEGAWPYLCLIAADAGLADPLDRRVVEAYWLGTDLVAPTSPGALARSLEERFRARTPATEWRWLAAKPWAGARPVHAFHVLDVLPRAGLVRGGPIGDLLATVDACRVRWGRVLERHADALLVDAVPLRWADGRMTLAAPRPELVHATLDGLGFVGSVEPGDVVAIHWDWACDRLDAMRLSALVRSTRRQLALTNQTI